MKRVFGIIFILTFVSAGASQALAQSRRVRRTEPPPKDERAGKTETNDAAKDEPGDEAKDKTKDEARAADDDEQAADKEITTRAIIKSKPNPAYPVEARTYGVRGTVKLRIILGADGKVGDKVEVLEGLPHGVTEEAIKAARRIKFEPARKGNRPVSRRVTVVYYFNLY